MKSNYVVKRRHRRITVKETRRSESVSWYEADATVRSYFFVCLKKELQLQVEQKRPSLDWHSVSTKDFMTILEDFFVTRRFIVFERYNLIWKRTQKKTKSLEQFHEDLVETASRANCWDWETEWVRDKFTAQKHNSKIAEELLAETRSPSEDAYEHAIRSKNVIKHSQTMKTKIYTDKTRTNTLYQPTR